MPKLRVESSVRFKDPSRRMQRLHGKLLKADIHVSKPRIGDVFVRGSGSVLLRSEDPRLVVSDPYLLSNAVPLEQPLPADSTWSIELLSVWADRRWTVGAAFATAGVPVRWERARLANGSDSFATDYARAVIVGADFAASVQRDPGLKRRIDEHLKREGPSTQAGLFYADATGARHQHRLWWFESGRGDGRYSLWWGRTEAGQVVALGVDFDVPALHALSDEERSWYESKGVELEPSVAPR